MCNIYLFFANMYFKKLFTIIELNELNNNNNIINKRIFKLLQKYIYYTNTHTNSSKINTFFNALEVKVKLYIYFMYYNKIIIIIISIARYNFNIFLLLSQILPNITKKYIKKTQNISNIYVLKINLIKINIKT